jgi:succinoglycan biosynthesis transport protein ExoP
MSKLELMEETPTHGSGPEFHPADLWRILVQHRWLVVGSLVVSLATAWVAAFLTRPMFRATTLIALEQERNSPLDIAASAMRERGSDFVSIETESRLLKSRDVLERVVRKLGLAEPGTPGGTGDSTATATSVPPPSEIDPVTKAAMGLQGSIEIRPVKGTDLLEVNVTAHSARKAADLANAVTEAYIAWKLDSRFRLLGQASTFLSEQIEEAKSTLAQLEENLLAFSRKKNILSVDPRSSVTLTRLDSLSRNLAAATADRMAKEAREAEVRNVRPETLADTIQTGLVSQLRSDQARLEREYQDKLSLYKPDWPAMQQLKAKIEQDRHHLDAVVEETARKAREMARSDVLAAQRREDLLRDSQKLEQAQAMSLNSDVVEYNKLRVDEETQRSLVDNLLKRRAEIQVLTRVEGERVSNVRIVERALPPTSRFRPSYRLNLLLGLVSGVLLGIGLAFGAEYMDRSLRTPEQVSRYLNLPVLGIIPAAGRALARIDRTALPEGMPGGEKSRLGPPGAGSPKSSIELLPHTLPRSAVAEAYRAFRTSLLLSSAARPRCLVVTSALPLEGKTTTAMNLAVVLAQLGKSVLLVDADLHRSTLHETFHVSNTAGLVTVLTGNTEATSAIKETNIPCLSVLPAGPTAPNPSALLSSDSMRRFLDGAVSRYDFVVVDTPPVLAMADPVVIGSLAGGVILCVHAGKTPRAPVIRARDELLRSKVRILGVLLNALEDESGEITYRERYAARYYQNAAKPPETAETPSAVRTG